MASNSAIVGMLRVLLTANTAEFRSAMKSAADEAKAWSRDLRQIGQQAQAVGAALTKTLTLPIVGVAATSAKAAMSFESSFAGVRKTVNATEAEFQTMAQAFRTLAKEIPVDVNELNRLGEAAGALGIPKGEIVDFARVMAELGVTTNVTSDQAAESIAKIQNIFGAAGKDTERFASTLVALGNDGASTESQILEMSARIAGAGNAVKMTQGEVLAFASALSSVGIDAEMGGSAISKVFIEIASAVSQGGDAIDEFAQAAGMSGAAFAKLFKDDAASAVNAFISGLSRVKQTGGDLIATLESLGFTEIRVRDTLLRAAGAGDLLTRALALQKQAWRDNSALTEEARKRFETTESQLTLLWNRLKDVGITIGNALMPAIRAATQLLSAALPVIDTLAKGFTALPSSIQLIAVGLLGVVAAAGPAIWAFGQLAMSAQALVAAFTAKGIATRLLSASLGTSATAAGAAAGGFRLLSGAIGLLTNPITLAAAAVAALSYGIYKAATAETEMEKSLRANVTAFRDSTQQMESALDVYTQLHGKQGLTREETDRLSVATKALAESVGLSEGAFSREAGASDQLTRALAEQLRARKELLQAALAQKRNELGEAQNQLAEAQTALQRILNDEGRVVPSTTAQAKGGEAPRALNPAERIQEVQRLTGVVEGLRKKVEEARAAYLEMAGGTDIPLTVEAGTQAAATAVAGLGSKLDALNAKTQAADREIAKLSESARSQLARAVQSGAFSVQELTAASGLSERALKLFEDRLKATAKATKDADQPIDSLKKRAKELGAEFEGMRDLAFAGAPSMLVEWLEANADALIKIDRNAQGLKVSLPEPFLEAARQARALVAGQNMAEWSKTLQQQAQEATNAVIERAQERNKVLVDSEVKSFDVQREYADKLNNLALSDTALRIAQIDQAHDAAVRALERRTDLTTAARARERHALDEDYQHQIAVATGASDTIVERMHAQGVKTRAELAQTRDEALRAWVQMKAAGVYTAEALEAAWRKYLEASAATGDYGAKFKLSMKELRDSIPRTIASAFVGGGDFLGAIKSIASQLGANVGGFIGGSIGGPLGEKLGEAIGSLAGPLIGAITKLFDHSKGNVKRAAAGLGLAMSEGLQEEIAKLSKTQFGGDAAAAVTASLGKIIDEAGGVTARNVGQWSRKLADAFATASWNARYTTKDLTKTFNEVFPQLAEQMQKSGGVASKEFLRLIDLAREFKVESQGVADFLNQQATTIGTGLAAQLEVAKGSADSAAKAFDQVGLAALASYNAGIAKGMDQLALLEQLAPALDKLAELQSQYGLTTENAAVQHLISLRGIISGHKELADASTAWNSTYAAMINLGVRDADALLAVQQQAVEQFNEWTAAGLTETEALAQIKGGLSAIAKAYREFGIPIDENTQRLIDQANAAGLLGDALESPMERAADSLERVADVLERVFGDARAFGEAFAAIPTRLGVGYEPSELPMLDVAGAVPGFALGTDGYQDFGSGTLAMLHGWEKVTPLGAENAPRTQSTTINAPVTVDATIVGAIRERWIRDEFVPQFLAFLRKGGAGLTDFQVALQISR